MDCLMAAHLLKPNILLFAPHGQKYERAERMSIETLAANGYLPAESELVVAKALELGAYERDDAIIPLRNLMLLSIAAQYGEKLLLGSMYGDRSSDKSECFFLKTQQLFDYTFDRQHWCEDHKFDIYAPFKKFTKTELVRKYLEFGGNPDALLASFSCYDPVQDDEFHMTQPCGQCKPCFRKWVALQNNGIDTKGYFAKNPWEAEWLNALTFDQLNGMQYRGREDHEMLLALHSVGHPLAAGIDPKQYTHRRDDY